jgi:hypothetical protein
MIGPDDVSEIFGIQTGCERCRADEIAEKHGELSALGVGWCRGCDRHGWKRVCCGQRRGRLEQSLTISHCIDAQVSKVGIGQFM